MSCLTGAVFSKIPHASSKTPTAYFSGKAYDSGMNSLSILYAQTSSVRDTVRTITTNAVWKNTTKKTVSNGIINQAISSAEEGAYDAVKSVLVDLALVESNDSRKVARAVFKWAS